MASGLHPRLTCSRRLGRMPDGPQHLCAARRRHRAFRQRRGIPGDDLRLHRHAHTPLGTGSFGAQSVAGIVARAKGVWRGGLRFQDVLMNDHKIWARSVERFSTQMSDWTGSTAAFVSSLLLVFAWIATGPLFRFSDTWQLVINTITNVVRS